MVLLIYTGISLFKKAPEYYFESGNAITIYRDSLYNGETYVINSQGKIIHKAANLAYFLQSADHSSAFWIGDAANRFNYIDSKNTIALDTGIYSINLSDNGKYIIYTTSNAIDRQSLYRYDVDKRKTELIDRSADKRYENLRITPDGKTITYFTYSSDNPSETEAFLCTYGSKPESVGKNTAILAVSYDSDYVYYCELSGRSPAALYVRHDGETRKLLDNLGSEQLFYNWDYTEIFFAERRSTYACVKGGERIKVSELPIKELIVPPNCIVQASPQLIGYHYGIDTFRNKAAVFLYDDLCYINEDYGLKPISTGDDPYLDFAAISEDGNTLLYKAENSNIMKVSGLKKKIHKEMLASDIDTFKASGDFSEIYYVKKHELFCINDTKEPRLLADSVYNLYINKAGDTVFFSKINSDGAYSLYYISGGRTVEQVPDTEGVSELTGQFGGLAYYKNENGKVNIYCNTRGAEFVVLE